MSTFSMVGTRPLTDDEIKKCLDSFEGHKYQLRNQALFILGLNTGFRIAELLSLKISDIRPFKEITDYLTVERRNMKKKGSGRTVILNDTCKIYLKRYLDNFEVLFAIPPEGHIYLFKSQKTKPFPNQPISTRQGNEVLYNVFDDNEMTGKLASHSMRKTYAKEIHKALGSDISKTRIALGHKDISSTQHYLSFNNEEVHEAMRSLNIGSSTLDPKS